MAIVEGVANSSQVADGRGTEVASKETRLLAEPRRGRMGLVASLTPTEDPDEEEDWEEVRVRVAIGCEIE